MSTFAKKVTSAVLTSALVLTTAGSTAGVSAALMSQIDAANTLANENVIVDNTNNPSAYRLADTIQRKEALKVMMKLSGNTVSQGTCTSPFSDIADSDWACKYAVAALSAGFIADNATFRPDANVSKIEALKMVMKARGIERDAGEWKAGYVSAAVTADIAETFSDYNTASTRGTMFVWAAEAINSDDDDGLCELLGTCGDTDNDSDNNDLDNNDSDNNDSDNNDSDNNDSDNTGSDELSVSLNAQTPSDGLAQANTDRTPLLVFDVKAGSEDVTLKEATLNFIGLGDYRDLDNVSIYNNIGEKVSKTKSFTEVERKISFDKNIVVEAGTTMTFTVAGKISTNGETNSTYGVKLVDIKASSDVMGEDLVGALLVPAVFANVAKLEINADRQSGKITVGDEETLVKFDVEEKNDNEDVIVKTITLHTTGTADEDDLSNLEVYIEGNKVDSTLMVNDDEEIVMVLDYTLEADEKITVEVKGSITGSIGDTVDFAFESNDDVYAVGATSGMPVAVSTVVSSEDLSTARLIEGSEINVSFTKGDRDEATPDSSDVKVGTLNMLALTDAYEVKKITVTVKATNTTKNIKDIIENVELGGVSEDSVSGDNTQTATFTYEDIDLSANTAANLDLTFDILDDNTLNGANLDFQVAITEIDDNDEDVTYTTSNLSTILSSTSLDNKDIDIKTGSITIANVSVIDRDLVIGNGVETVLYKAKITTGDAENITINDFNLVDNGSTITEDFDKVIDSATLNIGGKTFKADIDNDSVDFEGINAEIAADSNNVEVLVTAVLKDNDNVTNGQTIDLKLDATSLDIDDSKGDTLVASSINAGTTTALNNKPTKTILSAQGTFEFAVITNGDNKDDVEKVNLAGQNDVAIAEFKMEADLEDAYVNELKVKVASTAGTAAVPAYTAPAITTTTSTVTANADEIEASDAVAQVTEMSTDAALDNVGTLSISVDGSVITDATFAGLATKIQAKSSVATAVYDSANNKIVVTAQTAGTPFALTDYKFNGSLDTRLTITTVVINVVAHAAIPAVAEVVKVSLSRAMQAGTNTPDKMNYNSNGDVTTIAALAAQIAAEATVATATVSGNDIIVTAATAGTPIVTDVTDTTKYVSTPYSNFAINAGTSNVDLSDTLKNVRLMDGSTVIATAKTVEFVDTNTVITFEDFTVADGESEIEGTIVADIEKYTTNGDETSAELGTLNVVAFTATDADVEGVQSDNVITAGIADTQGTTTISIVPATVDVAVTQSFGDNETEAQLSFTINTGNNVLDSNDVKITKITFDASTEAEVATIDNDDNVTIFSTGTDAEAGTLAAGVAVAEDNRIVSGDVYTFTTANVGAPTGVKVKIEENGVEFTINGNTYTSSNEGLVVLGTYSE